MSINRPFFPVFDIFLQKKAPAFVNRQVRYDNLFASLVKGGGCELASRRRDFQSPLAQSPLRLCRFRLTGARPLCRCATSPRTAGSHPLQGGHRICNLSFCTRMTPRRRGNLLPAISHSASKSFSRSSAAKCATSAAARCRSTTYSCISSSTT